MRPHICEQGCNGVTPDPCEWLEWGHWGSTLEGMEGMLTPDTHPHPLAGKETPFRVLPTDKQQEKAGQTPLGCILAPPPFPLPPSELAEGDAPPGAGLSDPGSVTPLAASPPAPHQGGE